MAGKGPSSFTFSGPTIPNGRVTVANGASNPSTYDGRVLPKGTGDIELANINTRFIYHGGPGGSGNWEH